MSLKELQKRPCVLSTFIYVTHHCSTRNCVDRSKNFNYILLRTVHTYLHLKTLSLLLRTFFLNFEKQNIQKARENWLKRDCSSFWKYFQHVFSFDFIICRGFRYDKIKIRKQNLMYLEVSNICINILF